MGQKVVFWFSDGQKIHFLTYHLHPNCPVSKVVLQVKHCTTKVVMSFIFLVNKTHLLRVFIFF